MSELEKLRKDFETKKQELQDNCPHTELSDWMDYQWAIGHSSGYEVKVCERCEKIIKRRTGCWKCGKVIEEDKIIFGDGKSTPLNTPYCSNKCINKDVRDWITEEDIQLKKKFDKGVHRLRQVGKYKGRGKTKPKC